MIKCFEIIEYFFTKTFVDQNTLNGDFINQPPPKYRKDMITFLQGILDRNVD